QETLIPTPPTKEEWNNCRQNNARRQQENQTLILLQHGSHFLHKRVLSEFYCKDKTNDLHCFRSFWGNDDAESEPFEPEDVEVEFVALVSVSSEAGHVWEGSNAF